MQALITGAGGFVGGHLLTYLRTHTTFALHGTLRTDRPSTEQPAAAITWHTVNLCDRAAVYNLIQVVRPDRIYHLAGQASIPRSFEDPWETLENNLRAPLNLFDAVRAAGLPETRILVVGSAEMYGIVPPDQLPITESQPFNPASPYSVSKIAQDLLAMQYHTSYQLFTVRVRPFNHIGPGQSDRFAVAAFAHQIALIEQNATLPIVHVGDLSAERDFTDVRDIVRAYYLTLEQGKPGMAYNVCSGAAWSMRNILDRLLALSNRPIDIQFDPTRLRPIVIPKLLGDSSALRVQTGWQPHFALDQTLRDVLNDWRQRVIAPLPATVDRTPF